VKRLLSVVKLYMELTCFHVNGPLQPKLVLKLICKLCWIFVYVKLAFSHINLKIGALEVAQIKNKIDNWHGLWVLSRLVHIHVAEYVFSAVPFINSKLTVFLYTVISRLKIYLSNILKMYQS